MAHPDRQLGPDPADEPHGGAHFDQSVESTRDHADRVTLKEERLKHWLGVGAQPSDRVARFLGDAGIVEKPVFRDTPKKSAPKAKAQARAKEAEDAAGAAAGSA